MAHEPSIPKPSLEELKSAANSLRFELDNTDLLMYGEFMSGLIDDINLIEKLDSPKLTTKYRRGQAFRPSETDNPLNAWYWKCPIKGADTGKLSGKQIVIKDNISVADVPMMNGSNVFQDFVPDQDATVVTRILDAGGEILGKAVCENYCFSGGSHTSATGPVKNPHNKEHMAGGSSSGCAALIVSGECDMGIGSDQGGSVRMPSSFSGCYGLKPTYGLVPYTGAAPIEQSCDHLGPMANSALDCALLLEVIAGYDDGRDPRQDPRLVSKNYVKELDKGVKGLKIGVVNEGFKMPGAEEDVSSMVRERASKLADGGATIENVSIPEHPEAGSVMMISILDGTLSTFTTHGPNGPNTTGFSMLEAIRYYYDAQRNRANDMPVTVKTVLMCAHIMRSRYGNYYSAKAQNLVREIRKAYDSTFSKFDLLVMPTTPMKAHKIPPQGATPTEVIGCALDMVVNTAPFDVTGHPSMSVPAGMSEGLPVGMMLTGRWSEDDIVLRAGHVAGTITY